MQPHHPLWANLFKNTDQQQADMVSLWMQTPLFADISKRQIRSIVKDAQVRRYEPGETIFHAGDIGMGAALILQGNVTIQALGKPLAELGRGDLFGEVALATDEARTADAVASKATTLVFFMKQDLQDLQGQHPTIAARLAINLARMLAVRLRHANRFAGNGIEG